MENLEGCVFFCTYRFSHIVGLRRWNPTCESLTNTGRGEASPPVKAPMKSKLPENAEKCEKVVSKMTNETNMNNCVELLQFFLLA